MGIFDDPGSRASIFFLNMQMIVEWRSVITGCVTQSWRLPRRPLDDTGAELSGPPARATV